LDGPKQPPAGWDQDDPGLPIEFGPVSNAEYDPEPALPPVLRETIRRARDDAERNARRLGMSRREFLLSACGAATTFLALNACAREEHRASPSATTMPIRSNATSCSRNSASIDGPCLAATSSPPEVWASARM